MGVEVKGGLRFDLSSLFIATWAIWAQTVLSAQLLSTKCTKYTGPLG
jgi:hypothetical protein